MITSLLLLATLFLIQARIPLALLATWAHCWLMFRRLSTKVLFHWAAFQSLFCKPVALHGVFATQVQNLALDLVEPHTTGPSPSLQPVQIPLQSLPTFKQIDIPTQLYVICKLTEGALNLLIQIIGNDWPQN